MIRALIAYIGSIVAVTVLLVRVLSPGAVPPEPPTRQTPNVYPYVPISVSISVEDDAAPPAVCQTTMERISVDALQVATPADRDRLLEALGCSS